MLGIVRFINIYYSPSGRSVLGRTVLMVLGTAQGRRPWAAHDTEGKVFLNTDRLYEAMTNERLRPVIRPKFSVIRTISSEYTAQKAKNHKAN